MMQVEQNRCLTWEEAVQYLLSNPEQQELVKACYYDAPLVDAANRYWCSEEWHAINELLPTTVGSALDIGAGNGIASYALAKEGWQVHSLEPDPSNLVGVGAIYHLAKTAELPIQVTQEFGETLPFPDQSFELVFARQVLHHAQDLQELCKEINRVLKPGGKFIAVRDHVISSKEDLPRFLESHPLHHLYGGENAFLSTEYINALQQAGLRIDHVLKSFDSKINYAPLTPANMQAKFGQRLRPLPGSKSLAYLIFNSITFPILLRLLSTFDNRPGRLYSFICSKPL
ncbi:hypothetical protein AM10699_04730 [Acaryochloris marina MBIC10699]|nr:class I SAM-dependent methyltransferase [Acaryochloris marina]BDM77599.1 hypothetical protein AM10699_04730 [Acaryochloris marina MBIC10699]